MGHPGFIDDIRPFAELAQNATTVVYKAHQTSLQRFVLLKRLQLEYSHDDDLAARFQEEARIAARVQHPNVVSIYSFGRNEEGAYIVAEFVEGLDLGDLIERSKIPPDVALFILHEAAVGLKAAHDKDVLHRDLKPSNILISHGGDVKLSDFGLASVSGSTDGSPSEIRGTLAYLAPEQILESEVDARSDLFSLGATFFEMLTGRRAFPGTGPQEIFDAILSRDPLPYVKATAGVDDRIEAICSRLLARDPADRYADADALIDAVRACRRRRTGRVDAAALSAFLNDPDAFQVSSTAREREPDVRVVSGPADGRRADRTAARVRRAAFATAAALLLVAAIVYAGVTVLGPPAPDPTRLGSSVGAADSIASDTLSIRRSLLAGDTALTDSAAEEEEPERTLDSRLRDAGPPAPADALGEPAAMPPSAPGYVSITMDTAAVVYAGSDSMGYARPHEPLVFMLAPGEHDITTRNPTFPLQKRTVRVQADDTTHVHVSLWATVGRLHLNVSPWAYVYIDGRYRGQTPIRPWIVLLPGVRELRLAHPVLGEHRTTITIPRGEVVTRDFILTELN